MPRLAPRTPDTFPDIDLSGTGVVLAADMEFEGLATGFNSSAWRVGSQVVKATRQPKNPGDATHLRDVMSREHELLERFVGEFMPETEYFVAEELEGSKAHVVTVQPFVEGVSLPVFLEDEHAPITPLREFLRKSQATFRQARRMPDIACMEDGFNVLRTSNIIITGDEGHPKLVDTAFGKTQRSKSLGPLWTWLIYTGSVFADSRLNDRQTHLS